jgi:2-haloacid dehalogenase
VLTDRRAFLAGAGALASVFGAQARAVEGSSARARATPRRIRAIAFDAFPLIDPTPIATRVRAMFPEKADALLNSWRTRQFEYAWLRTLGGAYTDFWQTTRDALVFAATSVGLPLTDAGRDELMQTYRELKMWPDVRAGLDILGQAGVRIAFLSNFTAAMLDAAVKNSDLHGYFEAHLTTDRVRAFKPDPRAYSMGPKAFGLEREAIAFCAAAGWDAAGAKWFGYPTFWLNRSNQAAEELGVTADAVGAGMQDLLKFVVPG